MPSIDDMHLYHCRDGVSCRLWRPQLIKWIHPLSYPSNKKNMRGHECQTIFNIDQQKNPMGHEYQTIFNRTIVYTW